MRRRAGWIGWPSRRWLNTVPVARASCEAFRKPGVLGAGLSETVRALADKNYALLKENPRHPSLQLKKVGRFWPVRIGSRYRALAVEIEGGLLWFWIGSHADYDTLV
jgi:hypothetical protein